jgi:hypothetical protein
MKSFTPNIPSPQNPDFGFAINRLFREVMRRIDLHSYGYLAGREGQGTAAPTTGTWAVGDYIWNSAPAESGSAGSKYWVRGWWCSVGGTPGTWLADRGLTGN